MEQSSNQCHYSNFSGFLLVSDVAIFVLKRDVKLQLSNSGFLQKTTKSISFHKVVPGIFFFAVFFQCTVLLVGGILAEIQTIHTGISSWPTARYRVWEAFTFTFTMLVRPDGDVPA